MHLQHFCSRGNAELEERGGKGDVGLDVRKAGSRHISKTIENIGLDHVIGLLVHSQGQLSQGGIRLLRCKLQDKMIFLLGEGFVEVDQIEITAEIPLPPPSVAFPGRFPYLDMFW